MYNIYTDGSCQPVRKRGKKADEGGWAALINDETLLSGYLEHVDYMDCEIRAAYEALVYIDTEHHLTKDSLIGDREIITIHTDCDSFVQVFERRNVPKTNKMVYGMGSFILFCDLVDSMPEFDIRLKWLRRSSNPRNRVVDLVARQQRELLAFLNRQKQAYNDSMVEFDYLYDLKRK